VIAEEGNLVWAPACCPWSRFAVKSSRPRCGPPRVAERFVGADVYPIRDPGAPLSVTEQRFVALSNRLPELQDES